MNKHIAKLAIAVVIFLVFLSWIGIMDTLVYLSEISLYMFLLGCILNAAVQVFRAIRFDVITREFGSRPPFRRNVLVHFISSLIGMVTPARLGEGGKVFLLKGDRKVLGFCFILEKIFDFSVLIAVGIIGAFLLGDYVQLPAWFFYLIALGVAVSAVALLKIDKLLNLVFKADLGEKWFKDMVIRAIRSRKILLFGALTVLVWLTLFLAAYFLMLSVGVASGFLLFSFITAISMMVGLASGLPGGLGLSELSYTILLSSILGITVPLAGAVAIAITLGAYVTHTATAAASYLIIKRA